MQSLKKDPPIPGQQFALISMVHPRNLPKTKQFDDFLGAHFCQKFIELHKKTLEYVTEHPESELDEIGKERLDLSIENLAKQFKEFKKYNFNHILNDFNQKFNLEDELIVSGFKIRGVYANKEQAQELVKKFNKQEPAVDIYISPVGIWVPYCPQSNEGLSSRYAHKQLDKLIQGYEANQKSNKEIFECKET